MKVASPRTLEVQQPLRQVGGQLLGFIGFGQLDSGLLSIFETRNVDGAPLEHAAIARNARDGCLAAELRTARHLLLLSPTLHSKEPSNNSQ